MKMLHALFFDFSNTTQTETLEIDASIDDYSECFSAVWEAFRRSGKDILWMLDWWSTGEAMKREVWDTTLLVVGHGNSGPIHLHAECPYRFLHEEHPRPIRSRIQRNKLAVTG